MPPKKVVKKAEPVIIQESLSDDEDIVTQQEVMPRPKQVNQNVTIKYNDKDNDRIQLAQAINNLTVKGDQFIEALTTFSKFKETVTQLDIQIDTKKKEYKDLIEKHDKEYKEKNQLLDREYTDKQKQLNNTYNELNRDLQNDYKNKQIETTQKLREYKLKGCHDIANENDMVLLKSEEQKNLLDIITRTQRELDDLKKRFDASCNAIRQEEKNKYDTDIKRQKIEQELTYKTQTAEMKAQLDQQKREVDLLNRTIEGHKKEIAEQRQLTIEIAQASSKAQITQNFKKDT
jgi:hypothetical protein